MSKLPVVSGQGCVTALAKVGFTVRRQTGSHIILQRKEPFAQVVVPNHREVAPGTLRSIIRQADLSVEEFIKLL
jgi:predicted RNA binding protein YcfA (HicA-like mRNA interferase family)